MGFVLLGVRIALEIYILILFARAILSWFPVRPGTPMATVNDFLLRVTGIPATEAQALRSRGDQYREYQRTTSAFIPWFPKA